MTQSTRLIVLMSLLLVVAGSALMYHSRLSGSDSNKDNADYATFMAAAHQAVTIIDPLQRCLHYPDLPDTHWNHETTTAYCQLRNRRTLQLSEIDSLLKQGKAAEVDRAFQNYLDAQLHDPQQRGVLGVAFLNAGFTQSSASTRAVLDEWKKQSPDSAFALAASGIQYMSAAQEARGGGWARDLSDDQVNGMNQQLSLARPDLDRAVKLQPAMTPAYVSMIGVGALQDDDDYMNQAARQGVKADPADFTLRIQMMDKAQSKWGSHFGGESEQVNEITALETRNPLLRLLVKTPEVNVVTCDCNRLSDPVERLVPTADQGVAWDDLRDLAGVAYNHNAPRLAIELYSEALRFNPNDADSLQWRAEMQLRIGDIHGAIGGVAQAAQDTPDDNAIAVQLGRVYKHTGKVKEAESTFLAVLQRDPDQQMAMSELGDLYSHGGHQPDKAMALADTLINRHPDNPDGYIVRACVQMDNQLPGRYDTIHFFLDHFGNLPDQQQPAAEMRAYLIHHPEKTRTG